jgi:hypothetical protein
MIAPYVNAISVATANRVMELFEVIVTRNKMLTKLMVEGLATIVQNPGNSANGFWPALIGKASVVETLGQIGLKCEPAVAAVTAFVEAAVKAGVRKAHVPVGEPVRIKKHPHVFGGNIKRTWGEWSLLLFALAFDDELGRIRDLGKLYGFAAKTEK